MQRGMDMIWDELEEVELEAAARIAEIIEEVRLQARDGAESERLAREDLAVVG